MDANDVRLLIRAECNRIGITAFAKKAGVSRSHIYLILCGQREPRGGVLAALDLEMFVGYRPKKSE